MPETSLSTSPWATAAYGAPADTTPMELAHLHQHLAQCTDARGRLVALRCSALHLRGFVLSRRVTTLAVALVAGGGLLLLL